MSNKKANWADEMIAQMRLSTDKLEQEMASESPSLDKCYGYRAEINGFLIQAIFGAEIVQKDNDLYMKFSKKPADKMQIAEIAKMLGELTAIEETFVPKDDADTDEDEMDIPSQIEISDAVSALWPQKVSKKELINYLLLSDQAIGRMQIGPVDLAILSALSDEYRRKRRTKVILFSSIAAGIIAAGVGTAVIVSKVKKAPNENLSAEDIHPDRVEITEDDQVDIEPDDIITDDDAPQVNIEEL